MTEDAWQGKPDLLPPDPELLPLHERDYKVRAWKLDDATMLIRGAVMDVKPGAQLASALAAAGGDDDGRPLAVHHMIVELKVSYPALTIAEANVVFEVHPQPACPRISDSYAQLVGLSVARGFTHKVRELFGGPRGCTHTTALLQAMAPVAVQCLFSMGNSTSVPRRDDVEARRRGLSEASFMRDTCHIWSGDGELWQGVREGRMPPLPLPMQERIRAAGLSPEEVELRHSG